MLNVCLEQLFSLGTSSRTHTHTLCPASHSLQFSCRPVKCFLFYIMLASLLWSVLVLNSLCLYWRLYLFTSCKQINLLCTSWNLNFCFPTIYACIYHNQVHCILISICFICANLNWNYSELAQHSYYYDWQ